MLAADAVAVCAATVDGIVYFDIDGCGAVVCAYSCHKGLEAVADAGDDAILELHLGPDNGVDPMEGWIGGVYLGVKEVEAESCCCDDTDAGFW